MTDYSKPTTPGDALRLAAADLKARARNARFEQDRYRERAETLDLVATDLELDAERWDQYQPKSTS